MGFQKQAGVLPIDTYSINYEFVGYRGSTYRSPKFRVRGFRFGFGNPLSATIFAYLTKRGVSHTAAAEAVKLFESKLYERKVQLNDYERFVANAKDKLVGAVTDKIPYYSYIEKGAKVLSKIGAYVDKTRIKNKQANPYDPDPTRQLTLSGTTSKAEQYVDYAISYWAAHPLEGPMYILQRDRI